MSHITPDELPIWVPGKLTIDSAGQNWNDIRIRGYYYDPSDVPIPPMRDYMIVFYRDGSTPMNRRCGGPWRNENVGPGLVSLLTNATDSHWHWTVPIDVQHLYISPEKVASVASDVMEREISHVELRDVLRAEDPTMLFMMQTLIDDLQSGGIGGNIYVEAVTNQVCVHLLRNYASNFDEPSMSSPGLSYSQAKRVRDYIQEHLEHDITLAEIASVANLSVHYFSRQFQKTFGCAPYAYVTRQRLARAKSLISKGNSPLKVIAVECGFSDQSHLTRVFRRSFNVTPGEFRKKIAD